MENILFVKNLGKEGIIKNVNFSMECGEMTAIMGPSGSGKSTLLYNISGMDQADCGEVWVKDTELVGLSEDQKAKFRLERMGFVFQQMNMISNLNIIDNIMLPAVHAKKREKAKMRKRAMELLAQFHIEELAERKVTEVSGGQLQRACICRSMMLQPEILFADEPTGALNQSAAEEVMQAFLQLNRGGTSILMVTHDSRVASRCGRILYVLDGEIRGELKLGTFGDGEQKKREQKVLQWLNEMGW